jgi:hypothetical protein
MSAARPIDAAPAEEPAPGAAVRALSGALGGALTGALSGAARAADRASRELADAARIARFARGRLAFAARDDDVFIATYPRSGTTWMQCLLHLLSHGRDLSFRHINQVVPWWERSLAHGGADAADFEAMPSPRVFKTHLPYRWLPARGRCVYIARDGRDVAVSYYHLYRSHLGYQGSFAAFYDRFLRGRVQYGSWFEHVAGWQARRGDPRVLLLRYEDMIDSIDDAVARTLTFLGWSVSERRTRDAIELTRFDNMKRHEDKFDHVGELLIQRGIVEHAFIREGQVNRGTRYLTPEQKERFARASRAPVGRRQRVWRLAAFLQ